VGWLLEGTRVHLPHYRLRRYSPTARALFLLGRVAEQQLPRRRATGGASACEPALVAMLNKIKLRLKQETEEETALKQKYEQLRKKKARRRGDALRSALHAARLCLCVPAC
jgi:hypothetical protein